MLLIFSLSILSACLTFVIVSRFLFMLHSTVHCIYLIMLLSMNKISSSSSSTCHFKRALKKIRFNSWKFISFHRLPVENHCTTVCIPMQVGTTPQFPFSLQVPSFKAEFDKTYPLLQEYSTTEPYSGCAP